MPREDTQFKKGMVANPKGRPKKQDCIRDMLREELAGTVEVNGETITKAQFIAKKAFALAATGDLAAIKYLSDQVDGAPKQAVEHSGKIETSAPLDPAKALAAAQEAEQAGEV
jgi:hypothetical protein